MNEIKIKKMKSSNESTKDCLNSKIKHLEQENFDSLNEILESNQNNEFVSTRIVNSKI